MEYASEMAPSGMMTVFYGADHKIDFACKAAIRYAQEERGIQRPVCQVANQLYAGAKVIAGHKECLQFIQQNARDFGIKRTKVLAVQGAFHTPLMRPALEPFIHALSMAKLNNPRIDVYSNYMGDKYRDVRDISKFLPKQMVSAVKWE